MRIGLHTGEARPIGNGYVALAVHQAARISAAAHGGQVLLSESTATAVADRLPIGATLTPWDRFSYVGSRSPSACSSSVTRTFAIDSRRA